VVNRGADLLVPGPLVYTAFGVFVQRVHGAWPTAVRKSVFGPICAATGAPKDHFGCQKATKKCKKGGLLEKLAKLIWIGKYHTILRVGALKKAVRTVSKCV
jgi:hypothetical protein